ncbi:MAG: hypothetical protein HY331_03510 [Chloroflexi bacterium]|nr:hypothetical protein [Chloroflexota bacterium]
MREPTGRRKLEQFLAALGRALRRPIRLYLVGGTVLVDAGLRGATLDIDFTVDADDATAVADFEKVVPALKDRLNVNVEPASPADFMPVRQGALGKSRYVRNYGPVSVYYYDPVSLVLAKVARASERDMADVETMVRAGLVDWAEVEAAWNEVRERPTGWLRHSPDEIERHLAATRSRLNIQAAVPPTADDDRSVQVRQHQRRGRTVRAHWRRPPPRPSGPAQESC